MLAAVYVVLDAAEVEVEFIDPAVEVALATEELDTDELLTPVDGIDGGAASRAARLKSYTLSTLAAPQVSPPPAVAGIHQRV
jgi:hypothetical protein